MISTIKPIPYGLRKDELMFEIINNLQHLETIIETVFQTIEQKVVSFGPTLSDINHRTANCGHKLNQLKTRGTRATKVFSSHKYPKTELSSSKNVVNGVYNSVCNEMNSKLQVRDDHNYNHDINNNNNKKFGQLIPFDDQSIDEKMKFFKVNWNTKAEPDKRNTLFDRIGCIRWHRINSLSSLLIFNTSEIAFMTRSQRTIDLRQNQSKDVVDSGRKRLDSAPKSMTTPVEDINEFHFMNSGAAPQMEALPTALPSLPGIADEFVSDSQNSFLQTEPTVANQSLMPNLLPVLPNFDALMDNPRGLSTSVSVISISNESKSTQSLPLPPPPPPPPPMLPDMDAIDGQNKSATQVVTPPPPPPPLLSPQISQIPPPPPPVGPPPPPAPPLSVPPTPTPSEPKTPMVMDNGRASLLESIRNAGGKPKAKTIKDKKRDKKLEQKENKEFGNTKASSGGGGDLMSDLMSRLALRRDGISGSQKPNRSGNPPKSDPNVSAMDRISAMIPPPVVRSDNELSDPEDDWND